jgi:hypothetical protein
MPVTLSEAQNNAATAMDYAVIDEFRGNPLLDLLTFEDAVSPNGGGTLTYGYRRLVTTGTVAFRALNSEYTPSEATTAPATVDLKPLGGSFQVDRVIGRVGPAATAAVALNMSQKVKAARNFFGDAFINGDSVANANGFDGLDTILTGSDTEIDGAAYNWSTLDEASSQNVIDVLDEFLAVLDGRPTALIGHRRLLAKIRSAARRAGYYDRSPGAAGTSIETYAGIRLVEAGERGGGGGDVIPVVTSDPDATGPLVNAPRTDLYAIRAGLDGVHGVSMAGAPLVQTWLPDFTTPGAVKTGEVEMGPVAVAVKATKSAAVLRNVQVGAAA